MSSIAAKTKRKPRARRTTPTQLKDACEKLVAAADGPVEFRSVRDMNEYIEANTEPLMSENPCECGEQRQWTHKYCDKCAANRARKAKTARQRRWRYSV